MKLNEDNMVEFIAPGFPGFYSNSIFYPTMDNIEWELFNNPNAVPEEILDWCCENADVDDWEGYKKEVCEEYIKELNNALSDILPNFHAEFVEVDSPREYNYTTDKCVGKVDWSVIKDDVKKYIEENKKAFAKWIKDNHSSYSGFISFYSNDADEWDLDGDLDHNEIGSILGFILNNEGKDDDEFGLDYVVWENVNPYFTFDMEELKKNFKFNVEPETSEDLENYVYDEETDTYIYNAESPGQQKLKFESLNSLNRKLKVMLEDKEEEVLQIKFIGVDDWNRPIFKPIDTSKKYYLSDVNNLFNADVTEEEIKDFYKDMAYPLKDYITYHGKSKYSEPMGNTMKFDLEIV